MSGKKAAGEDSSSEDEELTRCLLQLKGTEQPKKTVSLKTKKKAVKKTQSSTAALVEGLAKLLVTAGKKGQQSSSEETKKFMARQVLGKDLPVFNGKPEEWASFISSFENTTKECGFTDVENLGRLQKCLKGEALESVQCLLSRPENVSHVIQTLRMRYGRPEAIIESLIAKAKDVPPLKYDRPETIVKFGLAVNNLVFTIKSLNVLEHLFNPYLLKELKMKLPVPYQTKWLEWVKAAPTRKEDLYHFGEWMKKETEIACELCPVSSQSKEDSATSKSNRNGRKFRRDEKVLAAAEDKKAKSPRSKEQSKCAFCEKPKHGVANCRAFEKISVDERWKWCREKKACFVCFDRTHTMFKCRKSKPCGVEECRRKHHPLLHQDRPRDEGQTSEVPEDKDEEETHETVTHMAKSYNTNVNGFVNLMVLPVKIRGPRGVFQTYAMLDSGSTVTVIDAAFATEVGLKGIKETFTHSGLHPSTTEVGSEKVDLEIVLQFRRKC